MERRSAADNTLQPPRRPPVSGCRARRAAHAPPRFLLWTLDPVLLSSGCASRLPDCSAGWNVVRLTGSVWAIWSLSDPLAHPHPVRRVALLVPITQARFSIWSDSARATRGYPLQLSGRVGTTGLTTVRSAVLSLARRPRSHLSKSANSMKSSMARRSHSAMVGNSSRCSLPADAKSWMITTGPALPSQQATSSLSSRRANGTRSRDGYRFAMPSRRSRSRSPCSTNHGSSSTMLNSNRRQNNAGYSNPVGRSDRGSKLVMSGSVPTRTWGAIRILVAVCGVLRADSIPDRVTPGRRNTPAASGEPADLIGR